MWTIETKVLPLLGGLSGHLYLEVFNPQGTRICQIHGLATAAVTGQPKALGGAGDILKAFAGSKFLLNGTEKAGRDNHPHQGHVIFKGDAEEIKTAMQAILQVVDEVNKKPVPYILLSQNSNSVFMKMVEAIESVIKIDRSAVQKTIQSKRILPGIQNTHLQQSFNDNSSKPKSASHTKKNRPHTP